MSGRHQTILPIAVLALALFIGLGWLLSADTSGNAIQKGGLSRYQTLEEEWKQRFEKFGSERAYGDFVREASALSYSEAHELSHMIGAVLYERHGEEGIVRCTADFAFGCYHGFAGVALSALGLDAVPLLKEGCYAGDVRVGFGCLHGIGHGILSYLGNDELVAALRVCEGVQHDEDEVGGCFGGVFMEYNFNTMQSPDGIELRPFDELHPYDPCPTTPAPSLLSCYYELPAWWRATLDMAEPARRDQFKEIGERCQRVNDGDLRSACYRGIGNIVGPLSEYRVTLMREWCSLMPDSGAFDVCFREALGHLLQNEEGKAQLRLLCTTGSISYDDFCRSDL